MLIVVLIFTIVLIFWLRHMTKNEIEFYKIAQKAEGMVVDHTSRPKLISFTTSEGNKHQLPYYGKQPELKTSGQTLTVFYHPNNPKNYRLQSPEERLTLMSGKTWTLGIIAVMLLVASIYSYF